MFSFTKEQEILDISGIKIGGQPGLYPTVLFGGLFFKGDPDFSMEKKQLQNNQHLSGSFQLLAGRPRCFAHEKGL